MKQDQRRRALMVVGGYGRGQREQDKGLLSDSQELLGNQEINTFYFWWRSHEAPVTSLSFVFFSTGTVFKKLGHWAFFKG